MRRGILFTFDALLGSLLILAGVLVILHYHGGGVEMTQTTHYSQDTLRALNTIKMGEINNTWIKDRIADGTIDDVDLSVLEQIGMFWATGETALATNLTEIVFNQILPTNIGYSFVMGGDELIRQNGSDDPRQRIQGRRMITGIKEGESLQGSTSTAYLKRINDKRTVVVLTFGGFVGQGNITARFPELPADAKITELVLELDATDDFTLYINNIQCGGTYTPTNAAFTPDVWDVSSCNGSFIQGVENNISIRFDGLLNESYIAGGYLKALYKTDVFSEYTGGQIRQYLPGINGIINLYDSFYVPGSLKNMTMRLHYDSDFETYVTVGDSLVYWSNTTGTHDVTLTDADLKGFPALLDYDFLSNQTVPFRMASYDNTFEIVIGSHADVILITDLSDSMEWRIGEDYMPGNERTCTHHDLYHANATKRLNIARCLDIEFTEIIMNESPAINNSNREWLVDYAADAQFYSNDPFELTKDNLINHIEKEYKKTDPGTCIPCALNLAYEIFDTYSSPDREKFVLVMTDGIPTHCTSGSSVCNMTGTGITGDYYAPDCSGASEECTTGDCDDPINASINAAKRLYDDMNVSVYTVGIGPVATFGCTAASYLLETIANYTNASYFASKNASELRDFYRFVAQEILIRASQTSQLVSVRGSLSPSTLYSDSYIDMVYDPIVESVGQSELTVTAQTDQFNSCTPTVNLPTSGRIMAASVTSYSDEHWTDLLTVNGQTVFNLSAYDDNYIRLGDPYQVYVPATLLSNGANSLVITTGDEPNNNTGCSDNNSMFYTLAINTSTQRSTVLERKDGCNWHIEFEDGHFLDVTIPLSYAGLKQCNYTNADRSYDSQDAYDYGVYNLLHSLDFDDDGRVFVNIDAADLEIIVTVVTSVPYLWGPSLATLEVWR